MDEDKMPSIGGMVSRVPWAGLCVEGVNSGPFTHHLPQEDEKGLNPDSSHPRRVSSYVPKRKEQLDDGSCKQTKNSCSSKRSSSLNDNSGALDNNCYRQTKNSWSSCSSTCRSDNGELSSDNHSYRHSKNLSSSSKSFCRRNSGSVLWWGVRWPLPLRTLWICFVWVLFATPRNICADSNGCDFYGSGLEQDGRGVQPVYLSCSSGRVEWQYPRAGLRVILKSPHKDKEFHACIKANSKFEGARIYLEGHRSLLPLFAADDERPNDLVRCFNSYRGQAALYVEAEQGSDDLKKQVAGFEYDLQSLAKGTIYNPQEECRPCSEDELLRLYCSADFVARGTIVGVKDDSRLSRTTIVIKASKLFQQTSPVFRHSSAHKSHSARPIDQEPMSNNLLGEVGYIGHVDVPIDCGAREGDGEFLVMGVVRLGQPILKCAPRHSDWVKLAKTAHSRAQCVIET